MAVHARDRVLELPDAVARRAGRISADEEERMRRGFEIKPFYRLGPVNHRAVLRAAGGTAAPSPRSSAPTRASCSS
ncbi:MAG: hypothetical protein KatS3mg102_2222 [Planctomycetota bacterium]|nr:MAG: hypothetical protein KatS3mg102_2222 [Planctomycetota bacterium]